jgi:phage major head subunit gpT-like protein
MTMSTGSFPKDLWPGVKAHFGATYDEHPEEYSQCFDMQSSDKNYEERVQYVGMGLAPVKSEGSSINFEDTTQGYTSRITNVTYALGGIVTREAIEDGQYENLATRVAGHIAFSIRQTQENVSANVLNRFSTAGFVGGDGVVLGSASHPSASGNQSNILAVAADLSEASLEDMNIQIMNATDSKGLKISLIGQKLIIPTALTFEATRIIRSQLQSGTANNDVNALRVSGMLPGGFAVNHYLTDADAWFIKTNVQEGLIYQTRRATEFSKDNTFDDENSKMKGSVRFGVGWGDWRGAYGSLGA